MGSDVVCRGVKDVDDDLHRVTVPLGRNAEVEAFLSRDGELGLLYPSSRDVRLLHGAQHPTKTRLALTWPDESGQLALVSPASGPRIIETDGQQDVFTGDVTETDLEEITIPLADLVAGATFQVEWHITRSGNNSFVTTRIRIEDAAATDHELTDTGGLITIANAAEKPMAMRTTFGVGKVGASGVLSFYSLSAEESGPGEGQLAGHISSINLSGAIKLQLVGKLDNASDSLRTQLYTVRRVT